jgi:tRNA threonylcarbamoyladenosine biosynthesis protein TsaB
VIRVAIETSTGQGSVAVGRGDRVLAEVSLGIQSRHAEGTLPALDTALTLAGLEREAIEAVVVGAGPGSFTGVRVAGATAKGLAAGLGVPLRSYPSLLALAVGVAADRPVCALFDARRGEVYAGCWAMEDGAPSPLLEPFVAPVETVVERAGPFEPLFAGEGAARYREDLARAGATTAARTAWPRASSLLWLAEHAVEVGVVEAASAWEPDYVRASGAERGVQG